MIIDHSKNPRNFGQINDYTFKRLGDNPLCGDKIEIFIKIEQEIIKKITWQGQGCAISQSSASLMSEFLQNKTVAEGKIIFNSFIKLMTEKNYSDNNLGKLQVFSGVRGFPSRIKCAGLAWHTLMVILNEYDSQ